MYIVHIYTCIWNCKDIVSYTPSNPTFVDDIKITMEQCRNIENYTYTIHVHVLLLIIVEY